MKTNTGMDFAPFLLLLMASIGVVAGERVVEAELHEHVAAASGYAILPNSTKRT